VNLYYIICPLSTPFTPLSLGLMLPLGPAGFQPLSAKRLYYWILQVPAPKSIDLRLATDCRAHEQQQQILVYLLAEFSACETLPRNSQSPSEIFGQWARDPQRNKPSMSTLLLFFLLPLLILCGLLLPELGVSAWCCLLGSAVCTEGSLVGAVRIGGN